MTKALESLEFICKILNEKRIDIKWLFKEQYNTIKQYILKAQEQEKALEIIKEKVLTLVSIEDGCVWDNELYQSNKLTEEEFDTLKRWVGNGNL